jgi:hypothetical protein
MGKNSDIESISNSISITILHKILIEHTNKPESISKMSYEEIEYRGQSIKKINKRKLNNDDKKILRNKVIKKINNSLLTKYPDIRIEDNIVIKTTDRELELFFR